MKQMVFVFLLVSLSINAADQDQVHVLMMQSPAKFINDDELNASAQQWADQWGTSLKESELKVVIRTLELGKTFSAIDIKMRTLVQQILLTTCALYKIITDGQVDEQLSHELELEIEQFNKLTVLHTAAFHDWHAWINVLSVSENKQINAAIESVNNAIRVTIEKALAQKEWEMLTGRAPLAAHETIRKLTLFATLCANASGNDNNDQKTDVANNDSVILFDMIARAAEDGCQSSFKSIEASSQILMYETLLLEISYLSIDAYLQALQTQKDGAKNV